MNENKVTIVMPLRNYQADYLAQAVESIIHQSSRYWNLVFVVEKSDLNHFKRLLKTVLADPRTHIIENKGRKLSGAFNSGMKAARTDFIALLLSDDLWSTDTIMVLNEYICQYPDVDFFHSSRVIIDEAGNPISSVYYSKDEFSVNDF